MSIVEQPRFRTREEFLTGSSNGSGNGRSAAVSPDVAEVPQHHRHTRRLTVAQHPEILLTYSAEFPDNIKLRKKVTRFWPLEFKLRADYNRSARAFSYGLSCKDSLLRGKVQLDLPSQRIDYRKGLPLGSGAFMILTGSCSYAGLTTGGSLRPIVGIQMEFGNGVAMFARDQIDLRQKIRVSPALSLEVCGTAELPLPRAQYAMHQEENQVSLGEGNFHLHVAQMNCVVNL